MRRTPIRLSIYFFLVLLFGFYWAACGKATDQQKIIAFPLEDGTQRTTQDNGPGAKVGEVSIEEKESPTENSMVEEKLLDFTRKAFFDGRLDRAGKEYAFVVGVFKKMFENDPAVLPLKDLAFNGQFVKYVTRVVPSLRYAGFSLVRDNLEIHRMMKLFADYSALPHGEPGNPKEEKLELEKLEMAKRLIDIFEINRDGLETQDNVIDLGKFEMRFNLELAGNLLTFAAKLALYKNGVLDYWHVFAKNSIASVDLGDGAFTESVKKLVDSFPTNSGLDANGLDAVRLVFAVGALKETSSNQYFGIFDFSNNTLNGDLEELAAKDEVSASQRTPYSIREQYLYGNLGFSSLFIDSFGFYPMAEMRYFPPPRGEIRPKAGETVLPKNDFINQFQAE